MKKTSGRYIRKENEPLQYAFSTTIKSLRMKLGYTQEKVASKLKVERSTYAYWETYSCIPHMPMIYRLCDVFEISINDFFNLVAENQKIKEKELENNA